MKHTSVLSRITATLLILLVFTVAEVAAQFPWKRFQEQYGTMSFSYPPGWEVDKVNKSKQGAFNENYYMQPSGQQFYGRRGEVVIRIFEPMYVMEQTKSLSAAFSVSLFNKFNAVISDGNTSATRTLTRNGTKYFEVSQKGDEGFETRTIGIRSPRGNLYILCIAAAPVITSSHEQFLFQVAESIKGGEPAPGLSVPESAVKNWYAALGAGNYDQMKAVSCASAQQFSSIADILLSAFDFPVSARALASGGAMFNYSHLQYYTVVANDEVAAVRICGNVVNPNGTVVPFSSYGKNVFVVRYERGKWKVCGPM
jgi:hypothetical protein